MCGRAKVGNCHWTAASFYELSWGHFCIEDGLLHLGHIYEAAHDGVARVDSDGVAQDVLKISEIL